MIDLFIIIILHFVCDFLLQNDRIAVGKSSSNKLLLEHIVIYSLPFMYFGWDFMLITAALHFVTDYASSRIASYFWKRDERHWFFVTIGADQALHMIALFGTYFYLNPVTFVYG